MHVSDARRKMLNVYTTNWWKETTVADDLRLEDRWRMNIAWLIAGIAFAAGAVAMDVAVFMVNRLGDTRQ